MMYTHVSSCIHMYTHRFFGSYMIILSNICEADIFGLGVVVFQPLGADDVMRLARARPVLCLILVR